MAWQLDHFLYGITQGYMAERHFLNSDAGRQSTDEMIASTRCNVVALIVNQFQDTFYSKRIAPDNIHTISDENLIAHINYLHRKGVAIMLKPMVDPYDSVWRGEIHLRRSMNIIAGKESDEVTPWFESYCEYLARYAEIAEATKVEMFCLGCEMERMEELPHDWSKLVSRIRDLYSGIITYNMNINIDNFWEGRGWFRELDLLGVSGYFQVGNPGAERTTLDDMRKNWAAWRDKLSIFQKWVTRPLFFAETGIRPVAQGASVTGDFNKKVTVYSEEEQIHYYTAMHDVLEPCPWFYGTMWWKHDEHQKRPQYFLPDGHYVGCEPTPGCRQAMRERAKILPRERIAPERRINPVPMP